MPPFLFTMSKIKNIFSKFSWREILLLLSLIFIYQFLRLIFFIANFAYFKSLGLGEIIYSFYVGTLFDLSAVFMTNGAVIAIYFFPYAKNSKIVRRICMWLFVVLNSVAILTNLVDVAYFKFVLKRTTSDIFTFISTGDDVANLIPQFLKDYWYLLFLLIGLIFTLITLYKKTISSIKEKALFSFKLLSIKILWYLFIVGLGVFFIRGGLGLRPISPVSAANYVSQKAVPLVLNTPFTLIKSFGNNQIVKEAFFDDKTCEAIYTPYYQAETSGFKNKNVVIFVLESFSKEYIGYFNKKYEHKFTPFFDSLMEHSLVCTDAYANGRKSIEGLPAIIAGIPTLMDNPFITSPYSANNFKGIAAVLKDKGYNSSFFHGGTNGTLGLESFSKMSGFDKYFGRREFANDTYYDGHWGIRDEEFLQFAETTINTQHQPFINTIYTLSSHHPYFVPDKYKKILPKGEIEMLQSIAYADLALRKFFEEAKKHEWFKNTLFVFTADHAAEAMGEYYKTRAGTYTIPIVYYTPDNSLIGNYENTTQQLDIMPSILGYLGYDKTAFCFGRNIFDKRKHSFCVNYIDNTFQLIDAKTSLIFDGKKSHGYFDLSKDSLQKVNNLLNLYVQAKEKEAFLKAFIQQYNNRLITNKLF